MGRHVQAALEHGTPYEMDLRVVLPDKGQRWLHARARAVREPTGAPSAITGLLSDVTERRQREEAHAFLDAASQVLAALDGPGRDARGGRAAGRPGARGLVRGPARGGRDRRYEQVAVAHVDPEKVRWAHELQERYPPDPDAPDRRARRDPLAAARSSTP